MMTRLSRFVAIAGLLAGCTNAVSQPATVGTGASRTNATYTALPTQWGDGQRTMAFPQATFSYMPVPSANPTPKTVKDMTITYTGDVTIRFLGPYVDALKTTLTADERGTLGKLSQAVTFAYQTCPNIPVADQPRYTWQMLGTNYEFRPACPNAPEGLIGILDADTTQQLATFVTKVLTRLTGS